MKIEVGKFYKTRAGDKVRIYAVDAGGLYPIHAAILIIGEWVPYSYTAGGTLLSCGDLRDEDLMSEWCESKPRMLAYIHNENGRLSMFLETDDLRAYANTYTRMPHLDEPAEVIFIPSSSSAAV